MKQGLLFFSFVFSMHLSVGQGIDPVDSIRIASLQNQLKNATGTEEINILNDIVWESNWSGQDKTPVLHYAIQAMSKSESMGYEKGIGYAALSLSWYYNVSDRPLSDSLFKRAFSIARKINDARLLGWCYYKLWDLKKAFAYFQEAKDLEGEAEAATWLCEEYARQAATETDFSYCQRALELADVKKSSRVSYNKWISGFAYTTVSGLYSYVGDYRSSLDLIKRAERYSPPKDIYWSYATTYQQMGRNDSSVHYFEKALATGHQVWHVIRFAGYANQVVGNYKRAAELLEKGAEMLSNGEKARKGSPFHWRGEIYAHLGEVYDSLGNRKKAISSYKYALEHCRKDYALLQNTPQPGGKFYGYEGDRMHWKMNVSKDLSTIFSGLKRYDSALVYLRRYVEMKDSVDRRRKSLQIGLQLSNFKKMTEDQKRTSQLQLLQKDNLLSQAKLKQETFLKNSLAAGLVLLILIGTFIFRSANLKRKNEKLRRIQLENELIVKELESKQRQSELQQKATELEMQALRAQMNPHFIFNCLSSINRFVLKNETEAASDYLTRFSRLIRMVLINSQKPIIPLEDEIEMLRLYLDMERLRFKNAFDYNITYTNSIDIGNIYLPPLLLQPFCENAIWHGLMHLPAVRPGKEEKGKLDINITMKDQQLQCTIADNGIGRKKAAELRSKSGEKDKSLGLKITTDRLAILNQDNSVNTFFEMHDLFDDSGNASGTEVVLRIKYKEEVHEPA